MRSVPIFESAEDDEDFVEEVVADMGNYEDMCKKCDIDPNDMTSTWIDDEDKDNALIAGLILDRYTSNPRPKILHKIKNPKYKDYLALEAFMLDDKYLVYFQNGMPDGMWYCKKDKDALFLLAKEL
jgi:hypothetical protein